MEILRLLDYEGFPMDDLAYKLSAFLERIKARGENVKSVLQPLGGILGLIGCILSCPLAVVGGLRPQGLALETVLIDKNRQNQCLQPLGLISCILSCPPVVGGVQYPPRAEAKYPTRVEVLRDRGPGTYLPRRGLGIAS